MADDWGTGDSGENASQTGRSFGKGRGHRAQAADDDWGPGGAAKPAPVGNQDFSDATNDDGWGPTEPSSASANDGDDWGPTATDNGGDQDNYENRRGRGGGRGGRGGRGGGRGGRRDNEDGGDYRPRRRDDGDDFGGSDRRRNGDNENDDGENGEERKPPVTYIPPEPSEDDNDVFGSGITTGINFEKYDSIPVKVSGNDIPPHCETFQQMQLRTALLTNIEKSGYKKPTPIQKYAIPMIMQGRDLMGCAQTGSGKTAAYLVPMIHKLLEENAPAETHDRGCIPQVLIMAPTRELVSQIANEAQKFAKDTIVKCVSCYGGVQTMYQANKLRNGAQIIVATPGRLQDFVNGGRIKLDNIQFIVLDEADRMLDQGFLPAMEQVLQHDTITPLGERQTLMFSATFGDDIQQLAAKFLSNYIFLTVGLIGGACKDVTQTIYEVPKNNKRAKLKELLDADGGVALSKKTLVFVETKKTADFIAAYMSDNKFPSTSIHGDREQREREIALNDFKTGKMPILVATSVAARGLDIKEVAHVINYDLPKSIDEYVHRIGRTGRVGNQGRATSFYDPNQDSALVTDLSKILTQAGQDVPEFFDACVGGGFSGGQGGGFGGFDIRNNGNAGGEVEEEW